MQRYQVCAVFIVILFSIHLNEAEWLKMYEENYHRPTYHNKAHSSSKHVDYSRMKMDQRDNSTKKPRVSLPDFNPKKHKSFYVNIMYQGSVNCAGALISRRMVITSSRCFQADTVENTKEFQAADMSVITGNDFTSVVNKVSNVIAFFMPAPRNASRGVHDIALLALEKKLERGVYRYIPLYGRKPNTGALVNMAFVDHHSHEIEIYESKVVDYEKCTQSYSDYAHVKIPSSDEFFCVKNREKPGCSTRPGDPLIIDNKLAAINIYGEHCDELEGTTKADIYFSIRHSIPFMQTATDLLRAFTGTGPFNQSITTQRTQLFQDHTTLAPYLQT